MMCRRVVWLELDRTPVFAHGSCDIDFAKEEHFAERGVRFGQVGIKANSFKGGLLGLRENIAPVRACITRKEDVGLGQASVGQRVIWIARDRLLVEDDRFRDVVTGTPLP